MTIGTKFSITAGLPLIMMAGLGFGSLFAINPLSRSVDAIVTDPLPGVQRISRADSFLWQFRGNTRKHIASGELAAKLTIEASQNGTRLTGREGESVELWRQYLQDADVTHAARQSSISELIRYNSKNREVEMLSAQRAATRVRALIIGALTLGLAGAGILTFFMLRGVKMGLAKVTVALSDGAMQVVSSVAQLSKGSQSLAELATKQSASLGETSASLTEINSMAVRNTDKARAATTLMWESRQKVAETNLKLRHLVAATVSASTANEKIADIIKIIGGIAATTKLLALNSAVEAAGAGAAGTGFGVLADEVRTLAQQSAQAAKDTAALIEESIAKFNEVRVSVEIVVKAVQTICEQSLSVKALIDEVNLGSHEQENAMKQITGAMAQLEQVTQCTAANTKENASAAEKLSGQYNSVLSSVQQLSAMTGTSVTQAPLQTFTGSRRLAHEKRF